MLRPSPAQNTDLAAGRTQHMFVEGNFHASMPIVRFLFLHFTCSHRRRQAGERHKEEAELIFLEIIKKGETGLM